jgi:hypothetical protein
MVAARLDDGVTIKWLDRQPDGTSSSSPKTNPTRLSSPRTQSNPIIGLVSWWWNRQL